MANKGEINEKIHLIVGAKAWKEFLISNKHVYHEWIYQDESRDLEDVPVMCRNGAYVSFEFAKEHNIRLSCEENYSLSQLMAFASWFDGIVKYDVYDTDYEYNDSVMRRIVYKIALLSRTNQKENKDD